MSTTITIGSLSYTLVASPSCPHIMAGELARNDTVAAFVSPYTQQAELQAWQSGDWWEMSLQPPPLLPAQAAEWEGFLAELRGRLNVFQWADLRRLAPRGLARGAPVVAAGNATGGTSLLTSGWAVSTARQLLRGDRFQIGYRYHEVCETCGSDSSGDMTIPIWPSLREVPATSAPLVLGNPQCLLRLKSNRRPSQFASTGLTRLAVQAVEVR